MKAKYSIKCRFAPVGETGPLIPTLDTDVNILMLEAPEPGYLPHGLTIAGTMIFDMQEDGGVDAVEILQPLGPGLQDRHITPKSNDHYERLFLDLQDKDRIEEHATLEFERTGHLAVFRVSPGDIDERHLIGPGVNALVGNGELRGFSLDLSELMR